MILVVGGIASGKRTYVRSLGYDDAQMSELVEDECPVLLSLEERLRSGAPDEGDLARMRAKDVVVCCEVGQGVVPMDRGERDWRELVGRTCSELARSAERVVRMVCGIAVELPRGEEAGGVER